MTRDNTNIPGCPHEDRFFSGGAGNDKYQKGYAQIDWSKKPLGETLNTLKKETDKNG